MPCRAAQLLLQWHRCALMSEAIAMLPWLVVQGARDGIREPYSAYHIGRRPTGAVAPGARGRAGGVGERVRRTRGMSMSASIVLCSYEKAGGLGPTRHKTSHRSLLCEDACISARGVADDRDDP